MSAMEHRATFELAPEAASQARAVVNAELGPAVSAKVLEDATLLVSELVTNAVRHAPREGLPEIELRLKVDPARVRVVVSDPGYRVRRGAEAAHRVRELRVGALPRRSARGPMGRDHEGSQRGLVRDRRGRVMSMDPTERWVGADGRPGAAQRPDRSLAGSGTRDGSRASSWRRSRSSCSSRRCAPGSFEGVPGGFGALISVAAAIVCGPLAGALVSLVGGLVFVPLVTDFERGSQFSVFLWLVASVGAGRDLGEAPPGERGPRVRRSRASASPATGSTGCRRSPRCSRAR